MSIQINRILSDFILRSKLIQTPTELDQLVLKTKKALNLAYRYTEEKLNEKQVSARWKFLTPRRLQNMRQREKGPKYLKLGGAKNSSVFYKVADVEEWIIEQYQLEPFIEQQ